MALKQCVTCGETKEEAEFNYRNKLLGRRWGTCKSCQSIQRTDWYERNKDKHVKKVRERRDRMVEEGRQYIRSYLSTHPCVDCGESNPIVLEFDHVRGRKKMIVSQMKFRFYSSDIFEPPHVHVIKAEKVAKIWLQPISVQNNRGYHPAELNRVLRLTRQNQARLLEAWNDYFSQ